MQFSATSHWPSCALQTWLGGEYTHKAAWQQGGSGPPFVAASHVSLPSSSPSPQIGTYTVVTVLVVVVDEEEVTLDVVTLCVVTLVVVVDDVEVILEVVTLVVVAVDDVEVILDVVMLVVVVVDDVVVAVEDVLVVVVDVVSAQRRLLVLVGGATSI